ncbi:MAG TPA: hypothetical protein VNE16_09845 [Vicinamibacterales bacterium]|nr:hypothetical protein [Vicinamibacterales bacterium]
MRRHGSGNGRGRAGRAIAPAVVACLTLLAVSAPGQPAGPPLPDAHAFLQEARKNLASDSYVQRQFTYKERETTVHMNPFGQMGTGDVLLYEVRPSVDPALVYRRLIARNGVPLTPAQLTAEDRKQQEKEQRYRAEQQQEQPSERKARLEQEAAARRREQKLVADVVSLFDFTLAGRATVDGVPSIVVDFRPRAGVTPETREGRIASAFTGQAWVGEASHQVVRVEAESQRSIRFVAGFVQLDKGLKVTATRREIDGAWLPVETTFRGHGRAFFFRSFDLDLVWQYFDYQRIRPPAASGGNDRP